MLQSALASNNTSRDSTEALLDNTAQCRAVPMSHTMSGFALWCSNTCMLLM